MPETPENAENQHASAPSGAVYIWDVPTRLFHWSLVAAVATSLFTAEFGPMDIHLISGHVVVALILFRLVWGVAGGRYARFATFVKGPATVLSYARGLFSGKTPPHRGHNPMGGWSVMAMVAVLALQAGTGLFANDDILTEGALASTVSKSTSDFLTYIHHLASNAVYALIALHLVAVAFYSHKGHGIVAAMIKGTSSKIDAAADGAPEDTGAKGSLVLGIVVAGVAAAISYAIKVY